MGMQIFLLRNGTGKEMDGRDRVESGAGEKTTQQLIH